MFEFFSKIKRLTGKNRIFDAGFTLVEMVIVIAIVAIIATIFVGNRQSNIDGMALITERAKVVSVLQRAKSFALERKGDVCAFGVHFQSPKTMIIFKDLSTDEEGRCEEGDFNKKYDSGEGVESISLDEHINFSEIPLNDIVFIPPYLETVGGGTIKISNGSEEACVQVNAGGQIYSRSCE